jgi:hypothetical protein
MGVNNTNLEKVLALPYLKLLRRAVFRSWPCIRKDNFGWYVVYGGPKKLAKMFSDFDAKNSQQIKCCASEPERSLSSQDLRTLVFVDSFVAVDKTNRCHMQ